MVEECDALACHRRERLQQLSLVEVDRSHSKRSGKPVSNPGLAVKEYVRAGAGHHVPSPDELRPPNILVETIDYLMNSVTVREDLRWHTLYGFINNRCQSVRQDITYQQLEGPEVVYIYRLAVRFYIYAQYRLAGESYDRFDPKLNSDQIQQCLSKLLRLYHHKFHTHRHDDETWTKMVAEWTEAESLYLLTNLGSDEAAMHALALPPQVRVQPATQTALKLSLLAGQNNFVCVFRIFCALPPLGKCAVYRFLHTLRRRGLQILCNAFCMGTKPLSFPLRVVAKWLMFSGQQEAADYCSAAGLSVSERNVLLQKSDSISFPSEVLHSIPIPEASHTKCRQLITTPT